MDRFCERADTKLFITLKGRRWLHASLHLYRRASKKPIIPRLQRDELGINVFPTVHVELVNKTPVLSGSAKRRQERREIVAMIFIHPSVTDPVESLSSPGFREKITGLAKFPLGRLVYSIKTWPIVENAGLFIAFPFSLAKTVAAL